MTSNARTAPGGLSLPQVATSKDGYEFFPSSDKWRLSKDDVFSLSFLRDVSEETNLGFRLTLTRYAEEASAGHTQNMLLKFKRFLTDTRTPVVSVDALLNWRSKLDVVDDVPLGQLRGFLIAWHGWGFPGLSDDVASLLEGWHFEGNERGRAVAQGDPRKGPLTDIELGSILDWANRALSRREIGLETYAYLLTLMMTARRPVQIAALRGADLIEKHDGNRAPKYVIRFPRAKQRGGGFRQYFRSLPVIEDLYLTLCAQHRTSVSRVEEAVGCELPTDLEQQVPVFINSDVPDEIVDIATLRDVLMGGAPDRLHTPVKRLPHLLSRCSATHPVSERTGEPIHLFATRFRYTRGTNLRREGFGPEVIAYLLDHSDLSNVKTYTENTVQEAETINRFVGHKLAPFAQACMGTLVNSEREAIRGDDLRSRVPNHRQEAIGTCGNYGFCASGFRACYTCYHFQPWVDGPHKDVLKELYDEKMRGAEAGCARAVVDANDRLILAVEHCAALCEEARAARLEATPSI